MFSSLAQCRLRGVMTSLRTCPQIGAKIAPYDQLGLLVSG